MRALPMMMLEILMTLNPAYAQSGADVIQGAALYESRCIACHSVDVNRVGPMHQGVVGRKAGSVPDYAYSDALKKSSVIWNEQTLDQWLKNPEAFIPGQMMGVSVSNAEDRKALISYLKSISH
ncbi:c-type cytochrome [Ampullimonas aquatilis]|uniref:c-type cytochrome n=1 Tax=Ampullimonas aquatilis TaxID=1341549 RepID=UPI003C7473FD